MKTIRFYTKGRYMGFEKFRPENLLQYQSWIRSGNDLQIDNFLINDLIWIKQYCREYSKQAIAKVTK